MTGTEPTGTGTTDLQESDPPGPPRWRSAPAAALLNLTGLGLGHLYLGHRLRAAVTATVTVVLVVVAFATDAASSPLPWRVLAAAVLAGAAVDGWRLARPGRLTPEAVPDRSARIRPAAVAAAMVVAMVAAYLGYGAVGRSVYADALSAEGRADCPAAIRGFDTVTGPFELTLSRDVPAAAGLRAECAVFLEAQQADEQRRYQDAVAGYRDFRTAHPRSVLVPFASDHLRRTYGAWAAELRGDRQFDRSIGVYRDLLAEIGPGPAAAPVRADLAATYLERAAATPVRVVGASRDPSVELVASAVADLLLVVREFPETPAATAVPGALTATYAAATGALGEQRFCDALPVLKYFAGLPADAGDLATTGKADRARALLECGLGNFRAGRPSDAIDPLTELATDYPDDPGTPQARSAVIAARVAVETERSVPLPAPLGDDSPGSIRVVYYNDSPYEVTVRVAGPTAHEFVLPACTGCPTYGLLEEPSCKWGSGNPSHALNLRPGEYVDAAFADVSFAHTGEAARTLQPGYRYWSCLYVTNLLAGISPIGPITSIGPI